MSEIQRADVKARRNLLMGLAVLALAILIFNPIFEGLGEWLTQEPDSIENKLPILIGGNFLAFLPLFFIGLYCWRLGHSVIISCQFPSPNMKVVVDTPIVRGKKARIRGRLLQLVGFLLSAAAIGFPLAFWWILNGLIRGA